MSDFYGLDLKTAYISFPLTRNVNMIHYLATEELRNTSSSMLKTKIKWFCEHIALSLSHWRIKKTHTLKQYTSAMILLNTDKFKWSSIDYFYYQNIHMVACMSILEFYAKSHLPLCFSNNLFCEETFFWAYLSKISKCLILLGILSYCHSSQIWTQEIYI